MKDVLLLDKWKVYLGIIIFIGIIIGAAIFVLSQRTSTQPQTTPETQSKLSTPAPETLQSLSIESLIAFVGKTKEGEVKTEKILRETSSYTSYAVAYQSNGFKITGYMNVPKGQGPHPAIILNHGYFVPSRYRTGDGTRMEVDYLAQRGYVTVTPDYRGYGGSDKGESLFRWGYVYDILSLIPALEKLSFVDPNRIGIWGHSMGGMIAVKTLVANPKIKAAVLVAPVSADEADAYRLVKESKHENVATASELAWLEQNYGTPETNPQGYAKMSAINFFKNITTPIQIHHSEGDQHVPFSWSEKLYNALKNDGKDVELFSYPGQLHTFSAARDLNFWNQIMQRTIKFFDKYLK